MPTIIQLAAILFSLEFYEPYIEIEQIPEQRAPYHRDGANEFIKVKVGGGSAREVWLGKNIEKGPRVPLTKSGETRYEINVADPAIDVLLTNNEESHRLRVFAEMDDGQIVSSAMITVWKQLIQWKLPVEAKFTVMQRPAEDLPGSNGSLQLWIEDITSGQVRISIVDSQWTPVVRTTSVRPGDCVPLDIHQEKYVVGVRKLVNRLVGDDYGVFIICRPKRWEKIRVNVMLDRIENSMAKFIQDGQELSGRQFSSVLKEKMKKSATKIETVDAFLARVAARPEQPARPYKVRFEEGAEYELTAWLRKMEGSEDSESADTATRPSE